LTDGTFTGAILLTSNDPLNANAEIPVTFIIGSQGNPDISIVPASIADSLIEGQQAGHDLIISNNGEGTLSVSFGSDESWLQFDAAPLAILPSLCETLTVTINSDSVACGDHIGSLDFSCNDPDTPDGSIPVSLHVYCPDIAVAPIEISESVMEGEQTVAYITIGNNGPGRLDYSVVYGEIVLTASGEQKQVNAKVGNPDIITPDREITDVWMTVTPVEGSLNYGENDSLEITLSAGELEPDSCYGTITVSSNDPDEGNIDIAVNFLVTGSYSCDYIPGDINSDGSVLGNDITYAVNFFRGTGDAPPDNCFNELTQTWLHVAGDVNGDCAFIGSDVTYMVGFLRGANDPPQFCPDLPPNPPPVPTVIRPSEIKTIKTR